MRSVLLVLSMGSTLALGASPATLPGATAFTASLAADKAEGEAPLQVRFTATASDPAATFTWFVNDRQLRADTPTLTYTFRHTDAYEVTVSAKNGSGDVAMATTTTTVR